MALDRSFDIDIALPGVTVLAVFALGLAPLVDAVVLGILRPAGA